MTCEVEILEKIRSIPPEPPKGRRHRQPTSATFNSSHILQLIDYFQVDGPNGTHDCLVTDVMGQSLHSLLSQFGGELPVTAVKRITRQILQALQVLHSIGAVHTGIFIISFLDVALIISSKRHQT